MKIYLFVTVAAAVTAIACTSAYAQGGPNSMRAQYPGGSQQRGSESAPDSSLSPLLGPPPDYGQSYVSGMDASSPNGSRVSRRNSQTRNAKPSQSVRASSLYGGPQDYGDSYSAHFGDQLSGKAGAQQVTSFALTSIEGLSSLGTAGRGAPPSGKSTSRRDAGRERTGHAGNTNLFASPVATSASSFVRGSASTGSTDTVKTLYKSPW